MSTLQVIWFLLVGVLFTGYAILDGFDLGVGFWQLFNKGDKNRRIFLNAIGPVWDGNEVWLITAGGALFAAFPPVYASAFSGFYLALILVLFGLILRAVAIEFRSKEPGETWRKGWDLAFSIGSILPAVLFGVALGNLMRGVALSPRGDFTGTFFSLLNPYSLLIGLVGFAMIATQGALYLTFKTEGELEISAKGWAKKAWIVFAALFGLATIFTFVGVKHLYANFLSQPVLFVIPVLAVAAMILSRIFMNKDNYAGAFYAFSATIAGLMGIVGASLFPNLVRASNDPNLSLTVFNSSSSSLSLTVMLVVTLIGMPIVLGYTTWIYRQFKGKVNLEEGIY